MTIQRNPGAMTPDERLDELARILAIGYRRLQLSNDNVLAASPSREPDSIARSLNKTRKESA